MSSGMYTQGIKQIMQGNIDLVNDSVSVMLINTDLYTPDLTVDSMLSDIPEGALISQFELTGNTLDGATFRADDTTFASIPATALKVGAVVVFNNNHTYSLSPLICFIDNASQFPITPDGSDIILNWDTGANGIFKL